MTYKIISESNMWSTSKLVKKAEEIINEKAKEGWNVVSVSYGFNIWYVPTVFITISK